LCGVRGSTPAVGAEYVRYGGHTSCVALAHDDSTRDDDDGGGAHDNGPSGASGSPPGTAHARAEHTGAAQSGAPRPTLILDAGTGLQVASRLFDGEPYAGTIVLSHMHWDHTLGLPFFPAGDDPRARVRVMVPEQESGQDATSLLAGVMRPPYFPIEPTELRGEWTFATIAPGEHELEGFQVLVREIPHKGGRTLGYRVSDGRASIAYLPDHSPTALGPGEDGWGAYHPAALELARDADVLVHDSAMFPAELAAQADFGHAVADYAVELGRRAGVGEVVLFHHRHDRNDDALDELAQRLARPAAEGSPKVSVAIEGTTIEL
jgi:phosphoribosyl 1,2-cyclic phosphodiesterase